MVRVSVSLGQEKETMNVNKLGSSSQTIQALQPDHWLRLMTKLKPLILQLNPLSEAQTAWGSSTHVCAPEHLMRWDYMGRPSSQSANLNTYLPKLFVSTVSLSPTKSILSARLIHCLDPDTAALWWKPWESEMPDMDTKQSATVQKWKNRTTTFKKCRQNDWSVRK